MSDFILGAYAAAPPELWKDQDTEQFWYALLRTEELIGGLELPWDGGFHPFGTSRLASLIAPEWRSVVTLMPRTSRSIVGDSHYGLASRRDASRAQAVADVARVRDDIEALHGSLGSAVVRAVQIPSAPGIEGGIEQLSDSLRQISELDWGNIAVAIEHCDDYNGPTPQKGFFPLVDEIAAADASVGQNRPGHTINWARSTIESHDPNEPQAQIGSLAELGILTGLMFSGVADAPTRFGPAWVDAHLPTVGDEPRSLLTLERVRSAVRAAGSADYLGAKIATPPSETGSLRERIAPAMTMLRMMEEASE